MKRIHVHVRLLVWLGLIAAAAASVRSQPIVYVSGDIVTDTTWSGGNIYVLSMHVYVRGAKLTIERGAVVRSPMWDISVYENGVLDATGVEFVNEGPVTETNAILIEAIGRRRIEGSAPAQLNLTDCIIDHRVWVVFGASTTGLVKGTLFRSTTGGVSVPAGATPVFSDGTSVERITISGGSPTVTGCVLRGSMPIVLGSGGAPALHLISGNTYLVPLEQRRIGIDGAFPTHTFHPLEGMSVYQLGDLEVGVGSTVEFGPDVSLYTGGGEIVVGGALRMRGVRFTNMGPGDARIATSGTGPHSIEIEDCILGPRVNLELWGSTSAGRILRTQVDGNVTLGGEYARYVFDEGTVVNAFSLGGGMPTVSNCRILSANPITINGSGGAPALAGFVNNSYLVPAASRIIRVGGAFWGQDNRLIPVEGAMTYVLSEDLRIYDGALRVDPGLEVRSAGFDIQLGATLHGAQERPASGRLSANGARFVNTLESPASDPVRIWTDGSGTGTYPQAIELEDCDMGVGVALEYNAGASGALTASRVSDVLMNSSASVLVSDCHFSSSGLVRATGSPAATIDLTGNYWASVDPTEIGGRITDRLDDPSLPLVVFEPFLGFDPWLADARVTAPAGATFSVTGAESLHAATFQWQRKAAGSTTWVNLNDGGNFEGSTSARLTLHATSTAMTGDEFVCRYTTGASHSGQTSAALLSVDPVSGAPLVLVQPRSATVSAGQGVRFWVEASGSGPLTYQWRFNGADIAGATSAEYVLPSVQHFHAGDYAVVVSSGVLSSESNSAVLNPAEAIGSDARLMNLSARAFALTGSNQLIPGFVISGAGTKRMLVRAVGPGLQTTFGLQGALENPQMWLKREGVDVAANDDWGTNANRADIITTSTTVGAFSLQDGSKDAAMLMDLPAGSYTAQTVGVSGGTGLAIVELYDADAEASACQLVNISNRGFVDVGDKIMIPGFVVYGEGARTFLIRAVGPGLSSTFGLPGVLEDPVLAVFSGPDAILGNDDWGTNPGSATTTSTAAAVGAFPLVTGSKDAAFVVTLPPGTYTVQAAGKGGTTGVALVEIYLVP